MKEGCDPEKPEYESFAEVQTLNSMVPLWQRAKKDVSDEEYDSFYREKFFDYTKPLTRLHTSVEGAVSYKALLFVPGKAPYDYYTRDYKAGLQLYSSGVMIMDCCEDLLPEHFRFVRGVVDSQDLSLNISREMLQHNRQLTIIARQLEKKVKAELKKLMEEDADKYAEFFASFGRQLKYSCRRVRRTQGCRRRPAAVLEQQGEEADLPEGLHRSHGRGSGEDLLCHRRES